MKRALLWILLLCAGLTLCACGVNAEDDPPAWPWAEASAPPASPAADVTPAPVPAEQTTPPETTHSPVASEETTASSDASTAPALGVVMERQDGGEGESVRIRGLSAGGKTVWERVFSTDYRTELRLIEEIGLWQDRYFFNNHGIVTCLRLEDGATLWENREFGGASISSLIDPRSGNIYLCGWYGPDFFALDADGNTLADYRGVSEEFFWPGELRWASACSLELRWFGGVDAEDAEAGRPYYVDLNDFSVTYYTNRIDLDENERYWTNIFLSDFIEQNLTSYEADQPSGPEAEAAFLYRFCKINRPDLLGREGNYDTLPMEEANAVARRFFAVNFEPGDGAERCEGYGTDWWVRDGKLYSRAAEGELWNRFAVVREVRVTPEGRFRLLFDVYALDPAEYAAKGMAWELYHLTPEAAEAIAAQGRITRLGQGEALAARYPDGLEPSYGMPAGSVGYWLLRLDTDLAD